MGGRTSNMLQIAMVSFGRVTVCAMLMAIIARNATGTGHTHRIQIHVPHTYHHHTHTKLVPIPSNQTSGQPGVFPVMSLVPLAPGAPASGPFQPGVPGTLGVFPGQPVPPGVNPPGFPPGFPAVPGQVAPGFPALPGQVPPGFPAVPGQIPPGFPVAPGQVPPGFPQQGFPVQVPQGFPQQGFPPFGANAMYVNGDYEYIDMTGKQNKEKIGRADETPQPHKYKTIINIQETKDVPIMELLDLNKLRRSEGLGRIKVDVHSGNVYSRKKNSRKSSYYDIDEPEEDSDMHAHQSMHDYKVEELEQWQKVKEMLENQIREDFPGIKIKAELVPYASDSKTKHRNEKRTEEKEEGKHVGYLVLQDRNDRFAAFREQPTL